MKRESKLLTWIKHYETCFKDGGLEQQGLLFGQPSSSQFNKSWETIENEFNCLFFAIRLDLLNEDVKKDMLYIHYGIDMWPVEDILKVINKI